MGLHDNDGPYCCAANKHGRRSSCEDTGCVQGARGAFRASLSPPPHTHHHHHHTHHQKGKKEATRQDALLILPGQLV